MGVTTIYTTYRTLKTLKKVIGATWLLFREVILRGRSFSGFVRDNKLGFFMLTTILFLSVYVVYLKQSRPISPEVPFVVIRTTETEETLKERKPDNDNRHEPLGPLDDKVILIKNPRDVDDTVRDLIKDKLRNK